MGWNLNKNPKSICARFLKAKYYSNCDIFHINSKPKQMIAEYEKDCCQGSIKLKNVVFGN